MQQLSAVNERPKFFRGTVTWKEDNWPLMLFRSFQHKAVRRSNLNEIFQSVFVQWVNGFVIEPLEYLYKTIFFEDIGVSCPELLYPLSITYCKWERIIKFKKQWPLTNDQRIEMFAELKVLCDICAQVKKDRLPASLSCISLINFSGKLEGLELWQKGAKKLEAFSNKVKVERFAGEKDMIGLMKCLEDCLLQHEWFRSQKAFTQARNFKCKLWNILFNFDTKDKILQIAHHVDNRLSIYFATLYTIRGTKCNPEKFLEDFKLRVEQVEQNVEDLLGEKVEVPSYAKDKHTGGNGGYKQFMDEGVFVPENMRFLPCVGMEISNLSFEKRFAYESIMNRKNSSKSTQVIGRIMQESDPSLQDKTNKRKMETKDVVGKKQKVMIQPVFDVPVFQVITARHKKYTYLFDSYVLKGPYDNCPGDSKRFNANFNNYQAIRKMENHSKIESLVLPCDMDIRNVDGSPRRFISFPLVGDVSKKKTISRTTRLAENVTVLERGSVIDRVSDIPFETLTDKMFIDIFTHLYHRYVLGIGDSGDWNMIAYNGRIYGIDLEEERIDRESDNCIDMLFTKMSSKKRLVWSMVFERVKHSIKLLDLMWTMQNLSPYVNAHSRAMKFASAIEK